MDSLDVYVSEKTDEGENFTLSVVEMTVNSDIVKVS